MLHEIFYWVFNMSITATLTGVIVMLVRLIKRIPRRLILLLWTVPFLRMTFPIGLNSPYSFMSLLSKLTTKNIVVYQPAEDIIFSMTNSVMVADTYFPITYKVNLLEAVFNVASVIWALVALMIIIILTILYFSALYEIKDSTHLRDNIYFSDKIVSPAVYGIIRPKIVLPSSYKDKNIELVILHEKMHIRTADNLWRIIAFVIIAFHWFNPFCWLFLKLFFADLELCCDERTIVKLGDDRAKEYALSLLEGKQAKTAVVSSFGGAKIRIRIENILSFKKLTGFSLVAFTVLIGVIFYVLLTNAG